DRLNRHVVLKIFFHESANNSPQAQQQLFREARQIAGLNHSAVLPVLDFIFEENSSIIVMPYMAGGSLAERMKKKNEPLSIGEIVSIVRDIASALDYLHHRGITYKNLTPNHVFLDEKNNAAISSADILVPLSSSENSTLSGISGNLAYISPEQVTGKRVGKRSDTYSLGILLFELLVDKQPFDADTPVKMIERILNEPIPNIRQINPNLHAGIENVFEKALAKNPDERYLETMDLANDLLKLYPENLYPKDKLPLSKNIIIDGDVDPIHMRGNESSAKRGVKEDKAKPPSTTFKDRSVTQDSEDILSASSSPDTQENQSEESEIVVATDSSVAVGNIQIGGSVSGNIVIGVEYNQISGLVNKAEPRRILNAGFAKVGGPRLNRNQALLSNNPYDLLVDVGPPWRQDGNLVIKSEQAYFPEDKLPEDQQGYQVRVVFVAEDFSPRLSTTEIWVPAKAGQSYPFENGERASASGAVKLRVKAPKLGLFKRQGSAHGRLCLYYKGQLIQSALVSVGITNSQNVKLKKPNKIEVDYVIAGNFEDTKRLSDRQVQFGNNEIRPISVGLTLNDDGSGRHRILATYHLNSKEETTIPPAWAPYDSQSAQQTLLEFRKVMTDCYTGLSETFGKNRKDFSYDLLELAKLGDQLRTLALSGLDVSESGRTVAIWRQGLLDALKTGTVIQIARTGPANYIFPWALVYDIPLPEPDKAKLCKVIEEWNGNGIREKEAEMGCPYQDEEWHKQNIICPYGFWGLKHIIEQPTGALHKQDSRWVFDVTDKISIGKEVDLGVGVTNDIDQTARDSHLNQLVANMRARLNPLQPAYDRNNARIMLQAPEIVYFLCHGEVDTKQTPFLSIGEHILDPNYSIFPNTLEQWSYGGLNLPHWQQVRPLVFINGCHTTQLQPGIVLNFVSAFADLGASGVIGTEVSVRADMAMTIAEAILTRIGNDMEIGHAIREMRWEMVNRGNLLGLAYTPYCLANLHIERDN
ncbi:MAG TPA: hypothetical protein DCX54_07100, partial [Flavobacteriales bacterium]|nr:hypothetical protein [Flavobacteriales bacterium]